MFFGRKIFRHENDMPALAALQASPTEIHWFKDESATDVVAQFQSTVLVDESSRVLFTVNGKQLEFRLLVDPANGVIDVWVTDPQLEPIFGDSVVAGFTDTGMLRKYSFADNAFEQEDIDARIVTEDGR